MSNEHSCNGKTIPHQLERTDSTTLTCKNCGTRIYDKEKYIADGYEYLGMRLPDERIDELERTGHSTYRGRHVIDYCGKCAYARDCREDGHIRIWSGHHQL